MLTPIQGHADCESEFVNGCYVDVSPGATVVCAVEPPNKGHIMGPAILSIIGRLSSLQRLRLKMH